MPTTYPLLTRARTTLGVLAALCLLLTPALGPAAPASASTALVTSDNASFSFDDGDCGPPSTTIPGPPPSLIVVGQAMKDSWLMCYMKQDIEGQTFSFDRWGEVRKASFRGYPVECWTPEIDPTSGGRQTNGIVAQLYGWNLDHTQYVRFTYRIQLDGDYINNCRQEIPPPE